MCRNVPNRVQVIKLKQSTGYQIKTKIFPRRESNPGRSWELLSMFTVKDEYPSRWTTEDLSYTKFNRLWPSFTIYTFLNDTYDWCLIPTFDRRRPDICSYIHLFPRCDKNVVDQKSPQCDWVVCRFDISRGVLEVQCDPTFAYYI